ncbi:MAG: glycosyltransferase family 2 protein [Phycisphaeraceae bacterium]|nr:glycosyltransferase family 2 protein [Phycisphaeraceae bacterium]
MNDGGDPSGVSEARGHTVRPDLAVAVTAMNSMRTMPRLLAGVEGLASRVVVVDSGSGDGTVEACRAAGAEVIHRPFTGYAAQKQFALDQCRGHAWVLLLDSDESLEPDLARAIREAVIRDDRAIAGYEVNRKVYFMGGWLDHMYQPDHLLRLVRGGAGRMTDQAVHERLVVDGRVARLDGTLRHDSWADVDDMAQRGIRYARLAGDAGMRGGGARHLLVNPWATLFKQYVIKGGFRDGWRGLLCAAMSANATLVKHAYILAARHRNGGGSGNRRPAENRTDRGAQR